MALTLLGLQMSSTGVCQSPSPSDCTVVASSRPATEVAARPLILMRPLLENMFRAMSSSFPFA